MTDIGQPGPLRFFELLEALNDHDVEFVIIGGLAVILHGYERYTKDVDIVPEPSADNLARLWKALGELEARPAELPDFRPEEMAVPFTFDGLVGGGGNWVLHTRLGRIDVMQWVSGIESYEELRAEAVGTDIPAIEATVWFAGFDDLIAMKQAAGRPQDLIDITALRMAHGLEE
ncbi:MAG: nucleotidyltransferase [Gaiellaceae bacterium MAG52_C11]|nr:nucleotidyltransferase [Candidatus Gaiellasilicea maunaloa]